VLTSPGVSGPETDDRFERLEVLIRAESADTRGMVTALRALLDERTAELHRLIGQNRTVISQEAAETREYVDLRTQETRTHFDIIAESLRDDIRKVAEGHGTLRRDLDELKSGQRRSPRRR